MLACAQEISAKEEERLRALQKSGEEWYAQKNKVTVGVRLLNSGGRVDFRNLGSVAAKTVADITKSNVTRVYDTGTVTADGLRAEERDSNGNQTTTPGGRYQTIGTFTVNDTDADGNVIGSHEVTAVTGDFVSYTPGFTRYWSVETPGQLQVPGFVPFTNYSTQSEGGQFRKKQGTTMGVELQYARELGRLSRHIRWGLNTGVVLNSINSKTAGSVTSTLLAHTDYYEAAGSLPTGVTGQFSTPTYGPLYDDAGKLLSESGYETTVPIRDHALPSDSTDDVQPGGATVKGRWQVKGAYLMFKVGPSVSAQLTENLALSGSAGFAGAYAGTTFTATESFTVAGLYDYSAVPTTETDADGNTVSIYPLSEKVGVPDPQSNTRAKFLAGYYADLTLEWAANDTTSLFGGFTAQKLGAYSQRLPLTGQLAHIDLGSAVGLRGGISIKF